MIRPAILAVALAFAPAVPVHAGSLEDALRLVPADAAAAFVVPSVKAASDDLQLAIDRMGRAEAALGGRLTADFGPPVRLDCTYADLVADAEPGQRVLIDDGAVRLLALERVAGPAERHPEAGHQEQRHEHVEAEQKSCAVARLPHGGLH